MEADEAVRKAGLALGYDSLKVEQIAALCAFVGGRDVFVSLPTGYGKSLCYMLLPFCTCMHVTYVCLWSHCGEKN